MTLRTWVKGILAAAVAGVAVGTVSAAEGEIVLAPHRAVYEMKLAESSGGGVEDISGRLVFEISGSRCEGYVMNTRFVLNTALTSNRVILNDFQSSTWEDPGQNAFRFISKDYVDNKLSEETNGMAARADSQVEVSFTVPEEKTVQLSGDALFPVQHIQTLIRAAQDGERIFQAPLYDGTDGGEKIYATTAIIGEPSGPGALDDEETPADAIMAGEPRWPVVMSYFDESSENAEEGLPIYQMSFEIYENGVTRTLALDYGDFKLDGELSKIEMFEPTDCS